LDYINISLDEAITDKKIINVLDELRAKELIFRRETSAFDEACEHIFKHALLRDVTYEGVLLRVRQAYHALAADWLIEHSGGRVKEFTGMIADHLELAGRNTQARQYLLRAGKQAAEKFANPEAISYLNRALTLTAETDLEARYEILLERVKIYNLLGSREAQEMDIEALMALAEEIGDYEMQAEALLRQAGFAARTGDLQCSLEASKSVVSLASESGDVKLEAAGHLAWGRVLWWQYQWSKAKDQFKITLELARKTDSQRLVGQALRLLGIIEDYQGEHDASIHHFQETLALYRKLGDRIGEINILTTIGLFYFHHFEIDQALEYYQTGLALCREVGYSLSEGDLLSNLGYIFTEIGMYSKAQTAFEQALAIDRQIQYLSGIGYTTYGLGFIACFIEKNYKKVKAYSDEGLSAAKILKNTYFETLSLFLQTYAQIGLENWDEADRLTKFTSELIFRPHRMNYVWENLAQIYMAKGMLDAAVEQVDLILDNFETYESMVEPKTGKLLYLNTCCQVLLTCGDARSNQIIEYAYMQVQEYASKIQNMEYRKSFLNNIPWNKGIIALWEAEQ
jgi:tetratricopeptide (TPR) repeat protein